MIEIGTVGTVVDGVYRPGRDVTTVMVEDSWPGDSWTVRATRVVGPLAYDDRPHRLGVEVLVKDALIRAIGRETWHNGGSPVLDWIAGPPAVRPTSSWKQLGGHRVLADGSILEPDWIYACSYEVPRSVLQGATRTVT